MILSLTDKMLLRGKRGIMALAMILLGISALGAEENETRPVTGIYSLELGEVRSVATYLSPLHYHGFLTGVFGRWVKAMPFDARNVVMDFDGGLLYSGMLNPSGTASMMNFQANLSYGMSWRKRLPYSMQFTAGGWYGLEGGGLWLFRNSNNPVEARFWTGIGISGSISWHTHIGWLPLLLTEKVNLPVAGGFFSPQYGESYYEIYLGNRSGLAHFGWMGNYFGIDSRLSVILDFGRTAMEIGYRFGMRNQESDHLVTREWQHAFSIGVIPDGIGLKNKKKNSVNALY